MNRRTLFRPLVLVLVSTAFSCNRAQPAEKAAADEAEPHDHAAHDDRAAEAPEKGAEKDHAGHGDQGAKAASDLDRSVDALAKLTCEHDKKTFECDECRYEVGFVRAPAMLMQGGLLKTTKPERRKVEAPVALTGEIRFDERRVGHVSSQVQGIIKQVHVALGEKVKKGQPLIEIDSVAVGEGQADYLEAQAMLKLARRNFERVSELYKEKISSEKEYLQAKQEFDSAEIRASGAGGKLSRLGGGGSGGRVALRAPMDGTVLAMHAVAGEVVKTDESMVTVGDNTAVWVWADLYERDIAAVKGGQAAQKLSASISVKAYPGAEFPGTVDLVSPAMDEFSRTVKVRVEVPNDDGRLLAGMFATVKVFLPGTEEALAVPKESVLEDEGRSFVFVHHQGEYYVRRPVVLGRTWANWVEIKKGVEPAQTVVADGAFLMKSDVLRSKMGAGCAD
jgi:cobalt-zinc-cadmium efflux system membrane fusion protein